MKKIDRYIITKFFGTFFFIMALLLAITIVIDLSEKIDDLMDGKAPIGAVVTDYYMNFIPYMGALLAPFFVFITVIFFTSQMAGRSEIIAMLSGGISYYRLMVPYMFCALILAGGLYYSNHYLVPQANKQKHDFELEYITTQFKGYKKNIHRQIGDDLFIYMENYRISDSTGFKFSLEKFQDGKLKNKLLGERLVWNREKEKWQVQNYYIRTYRPDVEGDLGQIIETGAKLDTTLNFDADDFAKRTNTKDEMTTPQLKTFIDELIESGSDNFEFYQVEQYRRTSSAFSIFILTLIGMAAAARKLRGGLGVHIVFGITMSAVYEVIFRFSSTFSTNANFPPLLGAWVPNVIFGILAILLIRMAQK